MYLLQPVALLSFLFRTFSRNLPPPGPGPPTRPPQSHLNLVATREDRQREHLRFSFVPIATRCFLLFAKRADYVPMSMVPCTLHTLFTVHVLPLVLSVTLSCPRSVVVREEWQTSLTDINFNKLPNNWATSVKTHLNCLPLSTPLVAAVFATTIE